MFNFNPLKPLLKYPLPVNMNKEGLAVSFIWKNRSAQLFGNILIIIVLNPLKRQNRSAETAVGNRSNVFRPDQSFAKANQLLPSFYLNIFKLKLLHKPIDNVKCC